MSSKPLLEGEEIYRLIPQREPIVMVDAVLAAHEGGGTFALDVRGDNLFVDNGLLMETGLIEHIAQSAAAWAGYAPYLQGESPRLGFIGELKKFRVSALPAVGSRLITTLSVLGEAGGVTLMSARTEADGAEVVSGQIKIYLKEETA